MNALLSLTDAQLESRVKKLGRIRSNALVLLVLSLAEVHRRRIHLEAGHATLAAYCEAELKEERSKAWRLGLAAEAVADFPLAGELLGSKRLSVTALVAVKKALTSENHVELLNAAVGLSEDEARVIASQFKPVPRRQDSVRVVHFFEPNENGELELVERHELRAVLKPEVRAQLDAVKSALSHVVADGNLNDVLAECFRLTLEACERRKLGRTVSHSEAEPAADSQNLLSLSNTTGDDARSRHIPAVVRRAVWKRDGGCCSFVGDGGRRCGSRYQLEFDHWRAFSMGGEHTVENVRVLCARHNRYEAERLLGTSWMRRYFDRAA